MFPEIVRDDIFRLETRRLWLRWPTASDADGVGVARAPKGLGSGGSVESQSGNPLFGKAEIGAWRSEMEGGVALHLMLALKSEGHDAVGAVHVTASDAGGFRLHYTLDDAWRGAGLMTEAVQSAVDAAFLLSRMNEICASPAVLDFGGRRVLERCGFTYLGNGMRADRSGRGLVACDRFRLERKTWGSLKGWGLPGLTLPALAQCRPPALPAAERCVPA